MKNTAFALFLFLAPLTASVPASAGGGDHACFQSPSLDAAYRAEVPSGMLTAQLLLETPSGRSKLAELSCRHAPGQEVSLFCFDQSYTLEVFIDGKSARLSKLVDGVPEPLAQLSCK